MKQLLGAGRLDASGAYIDGVGLSEMQIAPVLAFLTSKGFDASSTISNLRSAVGNSDIGLQGISELEMIGELMEAGGYGADRVEIDPSVVRGLAYYTGPVYEAELTFEILNEKGQRRQFGAAEKFREAAETRARQSSSLVGKNLSRGSCTCW